MTTDSLVLKVQSIFKSQFFWGLVSLHLVYFLLVVAGVASWYTPDSMEFIYVAKNLKKSGLVYSGAMFSPLQPELYSLRPPLYGIVIGAIFTFTHSILAVLFVQNLLCIGMWWYLAKLLESVGGNPRITKLALFIALVFFPSQFVLANQIMADVWMEFFFFAAFYQFVRFVQTNETRRILLLNVFLALGLLCKPTLLFFWIPSMLFSLSLFVKLGQKRVLMYALIVPIVAFGWSWRNQVHTGYFHYSSITNQAMIEANVQGIYTAILGIEGGELMHDSLKAEASQYSNFKEKSDFISRKGNKLIFENIPLYLKLFARSNMNMFLTAGRFEMNMFFKYTPANKVGLLEGMTQKGWGAVKMYASQLPIGQYLLLGFIFASNLFLLVSTINFLADKNQYAYYRLFILVSLLYLCAATGLFSFARFKLMVYPLMMFTLPFFIEKILKWSEQKRVRLKI